GSAPRSGTIRTSRARRGRLSLQDHLGKVPHPQEQERDPLEKPEPAPPRVGIRIHDQDLLEEAIEAGSQARQNSQGSLVVPRVEERSRLPLRPLQRLQQEPLLLQEQPAGHERGHLLVRENVSYAAIGKAERLKVIL